MIKYVSSLTVLATAFLVCPLMLAADEFREYCDSLSNVRTEPLAKETVFECSEQTLFQIRVRSADSANPPVTLEVLEGESLVAKAMLMPTGQFECRTAGTRIKISRPDGYKGHSFSYCIIMRPGERIRDDTEYKVTSSATSIVTTRILNNFDDGSDSSVAFTLLSATDDETSSQVPKGSLLKMEGRPATGFKLKPLGERGEVHCHFNVGFAIGNNATIHETDRRTKP